MPIEVRNEPNQELLGKVAFQVGEAQRPKAPFRTGLQRQEERQIREEREIELAALARAAQEQQAGLNNAANQRLQFFGKRFANSDEALAEGVALGLSPESVNGQLAL